MRWPATSHADNYPGKQKGHEPPRFVAFPYVSSAVVLAVAFDLFSSLVVRRSAETLAVAFALVGSLVVRRSAETLAVALDLVLCLVVAHYCLLRRTDHLVGCPKECSHSESLSVGVLTKLDL